MVNGFWVTGVKSVLNVPFPPNVSLGEVPLIFETLPDAPVVVIPVGVTQEPDAVVQNWIVIL